MIGHALELAARDLAIAFAVCTVACLALLALVVVGHTLTRRADARYLAEVEREKERTRAEYRDHERRRSEMRCMGGCGESASERWGRAI